MTDEEHVAAALLLYVIEQVELVLDLRPAFLLLFQLGDLRADLRDEVVRPLVVGHDAEHPLDDLDLLVRRLRRLELLLFYEVVGGKISWYGSKSS